MLNSPVSRTARIQTRVTLEPTPLPLLPPTSSQLICEQVPLIRLGERRTQVLELKSTRFRSPVQPPTSCLTSAKLFHQRVSLYL